MCFFGANWGQWKQAAHYGHIVLGATRQHDHPFGVMVVVNWQSLLCFFFLMVLHFLMVFVDEQCHTCYFRNSISWKTDLCVCQQSFFYFRSVLKTLVTSLKNFPATTKPQIPNTMPCSNCGSFTRAVTPNLKDRITQFHRACIGSKSELFSGPWLIRSVECQLSVPLMGPTHIVVIAGKQNEEQLVLINNNLTTKWPKQLWFA